MSGLPLIALVLLPVSIFLVAWFMEFPLRAAVAAGLLGPLAVAVPDALAVHFVLWTWVAAWIAMRDFRLWFLPGGLVAVTAFVDPSYGYFAAIGICLMAVAQPQSSGRVAWIVIAAALFSSFVWVPRLIELAGPIPDPAGSPQGFELHLALSLAAAVGAVLHLWTGHPWERFALSGVVLLPFRDLLGLRAADGFQVFFVLLAAIAFAALWAWLAKRHVVVAAAAFAVLMFPIGRDALHRWRHPPPVMQAPPSPTGAFELVDVGAAVTTTSSSFREINDRWLKSDWVSRRVHLLLDWNGRAPADLHRVYPYNDLSQPPTEKPPPGSIRGHAAGRAVVDAARPVYLLWQTSWRRNWTAYVDGAPRPVVLLSPGYPAVEIPAGMHQVEFRRTVDRLTPALAMLGVLAAILLWGMRGWASVVPWGRLAIPAGVAALALPVAIPLFTSSLLIGHDTYFYFTRVVEVHENVRHGIFFPRWAPDMHYGAGQPLFLFHPPMFYWLAEFWYLLGFPVVAAVNLACAVVVFAAAAGMFLLGRFYFGTAGGFLAAAAYLYAPYFATNLYIRSALEEFTAFAFLPLALFGFGAYAVRRRPRYLLLGAAAYAGLVLSHLPATLMFTPLLLCFLVVTAKSRRVFLAQAGAFLLALGLSACVWVPVLLERQYVSLEKAAQGYGEYVNHFVYLRQLIYSRWAYGYSVPGPDDGMPFAIGWSLLLTAGAAWLWVEWRVRPKWIGMLRLLVAACLVSCVLMLAYSAPVWALVRPLQYIQLPWRLLAPVSLCAALLAAALGPALALRRGWLAAALALLILPNVSHLHPDRTQDIDPAFWTPRELALAGFETSTLGELTPRWMRSVPPYNPGAVAVIRGEAGVREWRRTPFYWSGEVSAQQPAIVRMSHAYFPGWRVTIDGETAQFAPSEPHGLIEFLVPPGAHRVVVTWGRSTARLIGDSLSLISLAVVAVIGLASLRRGSKQE